MLTARTTKAQNKATKANARKPLAPMKSAVVMQSKVKIVAMMMFAILSFSLCVRVVVGLTMQRFVVSRQALVLWITDIRHARIPASATSAASVSLQVSRAGMAVGLRSLNMHRASVVMPAHRLVPYHSGANTDN